MEQPRGAWNRGQRLLIVVPYLQPGKKTASGVFDYSFILTTSSLLACNYLNQSILPYLDAFERMRSASALIFARVQERKRNNF